MKEKLKKSELETVPELQEGLFPQELPLADLEMADAPEEAEEAEDLFVLFEHKDLDTDGVLPEKYGLDEAESGDEEVSENERSSAPEPSYEEKTDEPVLFIFRRSARSHCSIAKAKSKSPNALSKPRWSILSLHSRALCW